MYLQGEVLETNSMRHIQGLRRGKVKNDQVYKISNITTLKEVVKIKSNKFCNYYVKRNASTQDIGIFAVQNAPFRDKHNLI